MKKLKLILVTVLFSINSLPAADRELAVDKAHTEIEFSVKHLVIATVKGNFKQFDATAGFDSETGKLSAVNVTIKAASIDTNEADRDKHLKSADFFEVNKYPLINFVSEGGKIKKGASSSLKGKLTIRNITKDVKLKLVYKGKISDPWGNVHHVFEMEGEINRKDFGLNWNKTLDTGGVMVSDEVKIMIQAQFLEK